MAMTTIVAIFALTILLDLLVTIKLYRIIKGQKDEFIEKVIRETNQFRRQLADLHKRMDEKIESIVEEKTQKRRRYKVKPKENECKKTS